jgi:hypothetical protein
MPAITSVAYDLTMELSDGTVVGLMLARDEEEQPIYQTSYTPLLPPSQREGATGYGMFDPVIDLPLAQNDWWLGIGHQNMEQQRPESSVQVASLDSIDTSVRRVLFLAPNTQAMTKGAFTPDFFLETGAGSLLAFAGTAVYVWNTTTTTWDVADVTLDAAISGQPVEYDAILYAPLGDSQAYQYSSNNFATATASTITSEGKFAVSFVVYHDSSNAPTLVKHLNTNEVATSTNPINGGSWSASTEIGDTSVGINWLQPMGGTAKQDNLIIFKDDGIYSFDEGGNVQHENVDYRGRPFANYGYGAYVWRDKSVFYQVNGALMRWFPFANTDREPEMVYPPPFAFGTSRNIGQPQFVTGDWRGIYMVIKNADGNYRLLFGYPTEFSVSQAALGERREMWSWTWGIDLGANDSDAMFVAQQNGVANDWLLFRQGGEVRRLVLPRPGLTPLTDGNCEFAATGAALCPWLDADLVEQRKDIHFIRLTGFNVSAAEQVVPRFALDGGGNPESLTFTGTSVWQSGTRFRHELPASTRGDRIMTQLELRRGAVTATPQVFGYAWHTTLRGTPRITREFTVLADDQLTLRNKSQDLIQTGEFIEDTLRQAMDPARQVGPVRMGDNRSPRRTFWAELHQVQEVYASVGSNAQRRRYKRAYSILAVDSTEGLSSPARYNENFLYGDSNQYARAP